MKKDKDLQSRKRAAADTASATGRESGQKNHKNRSEKSRQKDRKKQPEKDRLQYHPPMCASMMLELRENKEELFFDSEHKLNTQPNSVDFIVTKPDGVTVKSGLGAIFKRVNMVEYKSPASALGKRVYYRTTAYVGLYIAYEKEDYQPEDFTITFIRKEKPELLMIYLQERGYEIKEYEKGIYHVRQKGHIDMQILVTHLLREQYKWITKLTDCLERSDIEAMLEEMGNLEDAQDLIHAESVWNLVVQLNKNKEWVKELIGMGALRDLFKEEFEKRDTKIIEQDTKIIEQDTKISKLEDELHSKDEQLQSKDEQLQSKEEQLQRDKKEISRLQEIIRKLEQNVQASLW